MGAKLYEAINSLTHRWINLDEIVRSTKRIHRITTNHAEVESILNTYDLDRRTKHGQLEVRQKNAAAAEIHRAAAFAAIREIKTELQNVTSLKINSGHFSNTDTMSSLEKNSTPHNGQHSPLNFKPRKENLNS